MPDATPWLERAAALAPLIRGCADESERGRRLAADVPSHLERLGRITLGLDPGPGPI